MNKDFHYGAVTVLARWAGYSKEETHTIAYASQFVDELTVNGQIRFDKDNYYGAVKSYTFRQTVKDTAESVEYLLENLIDLTNRDTWMPFHFISDRDDMVTKANNSIARKMVENAIEDAHRNPKYALHRLGAALHSFADTWAHDGFIGRATYLNSVWLQLLDVGPGDYTTSYSLWETSKLDNVRDTIFIGHTTLLSYPDFTYRTLKYGKRLYDAKGEKIRDVDIEREKPNYEFFTDAAQKIYNYLLTYKNETPKIFTDKQYHALYDTMKNNTSHDYDLMLKYWIDQAKSGVFGNDPKGEPVRIDEYDNGQSWKKVLDYDKVANPETEKKEEQDKSGDDKTHALVPYTVYHKKWDPAFLDTDFYKFCEATRAQRFDILYNLLPKEAIYFV